MANNEISIIVSLRDQASREFNRIAASSDAAKAKIASLKNDLAGIAAGAGIAGLGIAMTKTAIDWGKAVDTLSDITGAAGEESSKLLLIGKSVGMSIDDSAGTFAKFGKAISVAKDSMTAANAKGVESDDIFSRLGLSFEDLDGKNLYDVFQKVVGQMRNMEDGADKDRVAMEMFGKSGYQLHDMLDLTQEKMDKTTKKGQAMGLLFSKELSEAAEQVDLQMKALTGTANKLAIGIGADLIPVLQEKVTWLQTLTDEYAKLDSEQRQEIARAIEVATELGVLITVVKALDVAIKLAAATNPWVALATAIGAASIAAWEFGDAIDTAYRKQYRTTPGWTLNQDLQGGMSGQTEIDDLTPGGPTDAQMAAGARNRYQRNKQNEGKTVSLRPSTSSTGSGADKAARDLEKAQEKINDMIADLQGKIVSETGTTLEGNLAKVKSEIDKMQYDIGQAADRGVDSEMIKQAQGQLDQFNAVMKDKYLKSWRESWQDLKNEQARVTAELLDDKNAPADAEYNITKTRLKKEREDKLDAVQKDKLDAEARLAVEQWYQDQMLLAERERLQKQRENARTAYQQVIEHNNLLITLEGKTQAEVDKLNGTETVAYIAELKKQWEAAKDNKDERLRIEQELAAQQRDLWEIYGRDMKKGWSEGVRQFHDETINYADYAKNTIDGAWSDIDSSTNDHLKNIMTMNEDLKDGIVGTTKDISEAVTKMFADMVYQKYILQPLHDWFSSILGGVSGGVSGGSTTVSVSDMINGKKNWFADGGLASGWAVVGEEGPELVNFSNPGRVYTASQTANALSGNGSTPNVKVNIINNSGSRVSAKTEDVKFNGTEWVVNMWLDGVNRNVGGSRDMLSSLKGG